MTTEEQQGRLVLEASTGMHGDAAKELSLMLCAALDKQMDYASRLKEVHEWAVCAPIATAEDMMQNISRIVDVTTIPEPPATPSSGWYQYSHYWESQALFRANVACLEKTLAGIESLFVHTLSNGVFNAWGAQLDCTALNEAKEQVEAVVKQLRTVEYVSDPHTVDRDRAKLPLGHLTDDELANAAFLHYDQSPPIEHVLTGVAKMPTVYMTAIKERVRWLSRELQAASDRLKALPVLERQRDNFKMAYNEWMDKTEWMGKPSVKELGMHRADVLHKRYSVHEGLLEDARLAVLANHEHHLNYDDRDSYPGSELYEQNYAFLTSVGCRVPQVNLDQCLLEAQTRNWGLTLEQLNTLKTNCLKPKEIAGEDKVVAAKRVRELLHWMARYANKSANPKWLVGHAFELAYRLATQSFQSNVDWHKFGEAAYLEGLNCPGNDRATLQRIGVAKLPLVWFNERGEIQGSVSDEQLDAVCRTAIVALRERTSALGEAPIWSYRRYGSPPEKGYTIVAKQYGWEPYGVPIAYLGDSPEVAKAIHELCDAHNRAVAVTYKAAP